MMRLSAERMYLAKWLGPIVIFGSIAAWTLIDERTKEKPEFATQIVALCFLAVILAVILKKRMWILADEVLDGGEYLLIRFGKRQERVNISDIVNVEATNQLGATTVKLHLN